ncbi:helix-turn-helix domain-containing protein [Nocardioides sp. W7]|uniref:helix-turn-helix domain-containing protein n=1 Tax=Nocardioides sp. W7 TaxID=2931390 RepID=UPI001FD0B35B|nr:helix-turn-helix domain-containing protein [Nocardioides sp. W7]
MSESRPVHDPKVLRAIAHPVRNRILAELDAAGSLRAADIARELGIPANQASFHLRQLAKYGLVEEDPEAARDRRDRVWRSSVAGGLALDLGELEKAPGGRAAAAVFRRSKGDWAHQVVDVALRGEREEGTYRSVTDAAFRLTKEEAAALSEELGEVLAAWGERTRGRSDDATRTYLYFSVLLPHPELGETD